MLASSDADFFRQLGYADYQIKTLDWDGKIVYGLGTMPIEAGDVLAHNPPNLLALSVGPTRVYLVPRSTDVQLRFETYISEVPATPEGMKSVLDSLLANANHVYRASVLEQTFAGRFVWPATGQYEYDPNQAAGRAYLYPENIFPLHAEYGATNVLLTVNTARGTGGVRQVNFDPDNVFGFGDSYHTWDDDAKKPKNARVTISSIDKLGVRGQVCEISSMQVFQSRQSLTGDSVNPAICGLFLTPGLPTTFPLSYFPKNLLSSSISYGSLDFQVRSRYVHNSVFVTNEVYQYNLVGEIRNVL